PSPAVTAHARKWHRHFPNLCAGRCPAVVGRRPTMRPHPARARSLRNQIEFGMGSPATAPGHETDYRPRIDGHLSGRGLALTPRTTAKIAPIIPPVTTPADPPANAPRRQ